jgi:hypothetical protein
MKLALVFAMGATLLCTACRKESVVYYKVHNVSLAPITIKCDVRNEPGTKEWYIPANSEVTIAKDVPGTKNVYHYKEVGEYMSVFSRIEIYRDNVLKNKTDIRQKVYWTYFDNDLHSADYTLIVHEEYL